jgi:hypothetical protein
MNNSYLEKLEKDLKRIFAKQGRQKCFVCDVEHEWQILFLSILQLWFVCSTNNKLHLITSTQINCKKFFLIIVILNRMIALWFKEMKNEITNFIFLLEQEQCFNFSRYKRVNFCCICKSITVSEIMLHKLRTFWVAPNIIMLFVSKCYCNLTRLYLRITLSYLY